MNRFNFLLVIVFLFSTALSLAVFTEKGREIVTQNFPDNCQNWLSPFAIQEINVFGNNILEKTKILDLAMLRNNSCFWQLLNKNKIEKALLTNYWIEDTNLEIDYKKRKLDVQIREAKPWLIADFERHTWIVSKSGNFIVELNKIHDEKLVMEMSELPRLDGLRVTDSTLGVLGSENMRFDMAMNILHLIENAGGLSFPVDFFRFENDGSLEIYPREIKETKKIILKVEDKIEAKDKIEKLSAVLTDLKSREETVNEIDLRFKSNVVVR